MSMPGMAMIGEMESRRAGWDLSPPLEDEDVIRRRHQAILSGDYQRATPEGNGGFEGRRDSDDYGDTEDDTYGTQLPNDYQDDSDRDDETDEQRRERNREYSRAGQERRRYRESLLLTGQDIDREGNITVSNPAVYRGWLEKQGIIPNPQQARQQEPPREERRETKPGPTAPQAIEVPPLDDPNDPMPDPFETEQLQQWVQRSQQRAVAHSTALMQNQMQQREFEMRQQQHQQQQELETRFGQILSPVEQAAGYQAVQTLQAMLPQQGMGALLKVPEFTQRVQESLKGGNVPLQKWTDPGTLQMVVGAMMGSDPALFQAVVQDAARQQVEQQNAGQPGQQRGRQGQPPPDPNQVQIPGGYQYQPPQPPPYQGQYRDPQTAAAQMRNAYGQFGSTNGGREAAPQYAPEAMQAAQMMGMSPERVALLSNRNLTAEDLKAYDQQQAQRNQRGGRGNGGNNGGGGNR